MFTYTLLIVAQYMILMLQTICAHRALLGGHRGIYSISLLKHNMFYLV